MRQFSTGATRDADVKKKYKCHLWSADVKNRIR